MSRVLIGVCFLFAAVTAQSQTSHQKLNDGRESLDIFLRRYLTDSLDGPDTSARVSSAVVRRPEGTVEAIVVFLVSRWSCGSGGCALLVLEPADSSYRVIGDVSITHPPVRLLHATSHGHHDLAVWVYGGGIRPGYEAVLRFDGRRYPDNPSVPPARRLTARLPGRVLISDEHDGRRLYAKTFR